MAGLDPYSLDRRKKSNAEMGMALWERRQRAHDAEQEREIRRALSKGSKRLAPMSDATRKRYESRPSGERSKNVEDHRGQMTSFQKLQKLILKGD